MENVVQPLAAVQNNDIAGYIVKRARGITLEKVWHKAEDKKNSNQRFIDLFVVASNRYIETLRKFHSHSQAHGDPYMCNVIVQLHGGIQIADPRAFPPKKTIAEMREEDEIRIGLLEDYVKRLQSQTILL